MMNDLSLDSILAHQKALRQIAEQDALAKSVTQSQRRKRKRKPIEDKFLLGILMLMIVL
jgi:hypothetical protein